ncbi:MAG TPA: OmpA family protein [Pyrinomonadaceae bacterium]|jgi:outer membrane protein OmpA-like peptidoglycan-associated protein|nr:OmpA family protein [Pyrinomonadaceae bacterium]
MKNRKSVAVLVTLACVITLFAAVSAAAQGVTSAHLVPVSQGQKLKVQGVVSIRNGDAFKVRDPSGAETAVVMTSATKVTSHGLGKNAYPVTYIMRGLRLQAQGKGDAEGNLVADWVRFDEQDLRAAQALEQTNELAEENAARLKAAEDNARVLAAQIAENTALAQAANAKAEAAQNQADAAFKSAAMANNRINGLNDYDTIKTTSVLFKLNSAVIDPTAKATIDEVAKWAVEQRKSGNGNGWMYQVVGFADTTGKTAKNRALSERRATAVIRYLVTTYNMDLRRLIQPFGYGEEGKPAADNKTAEGRAKNRRVEIIILQNKGIANTVSSDQ